VEEEQEFPRVGTVREKEDGVNNRLRMSGEEIRG
jgi:hypothetical protein